MRVPLLNPVSAVIYRLDIQATWGVNPPGDLTQGYDALLREPNLYDDPVTGARTCPRQEMAAIYVPCQIETRSFEELRMVIDGNAPITTLVLVTHRMHLETLGLIDPVTNDCLLKVGDRIAQIEKLNSPGVILQTFTKPLYVFQVLPASYGFGPTGHDLEIIYTTHRSATPYGTP